MSDAVEPPRTDEDEVLEDARTKFAWCKDWELQARQRMDDDYRFAEADSFNLDQWPAAIQTARKLDAKPMLTINLCREKCLQIINDARQNKPGIEIRAIGDGATFEAAKVFEGICRHIEYVSNAQAAYDSATDKQVRAGIGYWRVLTRYVTDEPSQDAFAQEIIIQRVPDPNSIYLDPHIQQYDGSDARFGFVFRDWKRREFEEKYPDLVDDLSCTTLDASHDWVGEDMVREAEFFRRVDKTEWLTVRAGGSVARESEIDKDELAELRAAKAQRRKVTRAEIEVYRIVGRTVIEKKIWPGKYIPIVRVVGEETVIDGQLDRKGHTRSQRDAQVMYNYMASAAAEYIALQSKVPWVGPMAAFEGYENYYETANTTNHAWLPYNAYDNQGRELPRPERQQPVQAPQAYLQAMQLADQQLMKVTGQYEANLGAPSNETSGVAIQQRQRKGDNATYHYIDHLAQAIRYTGRILIDLIPLIYDTPRVIQVLGLDGSQQSVLLHPDAPQAHLQVQDTESDDYDPKAIAAVLNPTIGRYEVEADVGPSFATKRQEEFNALSQIMSQNPEAMKIAGDLLFQSGDFPGADELSERWRRSIDPHLLGADGPPPAVVAMQQQFQAQGHAMQAEIARLQGVVADQDRRIKDRRQDLITADFNAETSRLKAIGAVDPAVLQLIVRQLYEQMAGTSLVPLLSHHNQVNQATQPQPLIAPGAQMANGQPPPAPPQTSGFGISPQPASGSP